MLLLLISLDARAPAVAMATAWTRPPVDSSSANDARRSATSSISE